MGGFHLRHRPTEDLDLFTALPEAIDGAERALAAAATTVGADLRSLRRFPDFRRFLASRGTEATVVDLVVDRVPQLETEKPTRGRVRLDSPREIAVNKLCALVGRCEPKDLVDLAALLESGLDLADLLLAAGRKDAGVNAAALAFVLGQWSIGPDAALPGGVDPIAVERFRVELVLRLATLALPHPARG